MPDRPDIPVHNTVQIGKHDHPLDHDLACHGCGYNLRGLAMEGRCPECNAPIRVALAGAALQYANPHWVGRLARGAKIANRTTGYTFLAFVPFWIVDFFLDVQLLRLVAPLFWAAWIAGEGVALWLLTSANPGESWAECWYAPRKQLRYSLVALLITTAACFLPPVRRFGPAWFGIMLAGAPLGLAGFMGQQALCNMIEHIADRIASKGAVDAARRYARGYRWSWPLVAAGILVGWLIHPASGALLHVPGTVGVLYFGGMTLLLPTSLAGHLVPYAERARECWAANKRHPSRPKQLHTAKGAESH